MNPSRFERQLTIAALTLLIIALSFYLLRELAGIFQPLLVAVLITYIAVPIHHWLVRKGIPSRAAHILMIALFIVFFYLLGRIAQVNVERIAQNAADYEAKLDRLMKEVSVSLPFEVPELEEKHIADLVAVPPVDDLIGPVRKVLGSFFSFLTSFFVVVLYLVFLAAEVFTFEERARRAFGPDQAAGMMRIIESINRAVGGYLSVMTLINFVMGLLTYLVLVAFDIPFALFWGLFMFLFAFIPFIGSVLVTLAILALALLEYADQPGLVLLLAGILVLIQQFLGSYVQPRLMGSRLGVSPLLILISLAFWGILWGIVGMLLAVPLLMVLKIALENIPETKAIATMMSNP